MLQVARNIATKQVIEEKESWGNCDDTEYRLDNYDIDNVEVYHISTINTDFCSKCINQNEYTLSITFHTSLLFCCDIE